MSQGNSPEFSSQPPELPIHPPPMPPYDVGVIPYATPFAPMPGRVKAMGTIGIVYAVLSLIYNSGQVCVGVFMLAMQPVFARMPTTFPVRASTTSPNGGFATTSYATSPFPAMQDMFLYNMAIGAIAFPISILLLCGAISLVRCRARSIHWLRLWAWIALARNTVLVMIQPLIMMEMQRKLLSTFSPGSMRSMAPSFNLSMTVAAYTNAILGMAILSVFPVLVLVLISRKVLAGHLR